ncbi:MAG TPA: EVE domain-containing protein [Anaeromyxobacteraceae bacterium]|nr:EVE domain-containing protein [Anaeromyxobacteraceae bacterium]
MAHWLLKTEPEQYAFEDLLRDGTTAWSGVRNSQAQQNLRSMKEGDWAIIYHSGDKLAMGVAQVVREAYRDPAAGTEGLVCVDVRAARSLPAPVPLEAIKQEPAFAGSALLRQGRLSVVPLSPAEWEDLLQLSEVIAKTGGLRRKKRF